MREEIERIRASVEECKRKYSVTQEVTIIPASKTVSAERVNELKEYGITVAGENRVQELLEKYDKVSGIEWHLIGALQTNKVKYIIDKVKLIHSVDRESLVDEIEKQASKRGICVDVLVEINVGEEESKSGVSSEKAKALMEYVVTKTHVRLRGIMSVLPINAPDSLYQKMQEFSRYATEKYGASVLSMGMSGDYEKAIRYGSNMIRIGSAIFGKRIYQQEK